MQKAIFSAGCFWGVEHSFRQQPGVVDVKSGYIGGKIESPTYKQVCSDTTGHAEAVQIEYDESKTSFQNLLDCFWQLHDPTTLNRQGPDFGSQYRSGIFYLDKEQEKIAQDSLENRQSQIGDKKIVTQIVAATQFWLAEEYHQRYIEKNNLASCHI